MKPPLSNGSRAEPGYAGSNPDNHEVSIHYPQELPEPTHKSKQGSQIAPQPETAADTEAGTVAIEAPEPAPHRNSLMSNLIFLVAGALIASGGIFVTRQPETPPIQLQPPPTVAPTATQLPTPTPEPITVFVSGAVRQPGLYELFNAARVGDALRLAGGLLPDAESALINQAERLFDGAQVHVPSAILAIEVEAPPQVENPALLSNQPPAGISGSTAPADSPAGSGNGNLINVNTATAAELETLPGVGASRAAEIIAGRPYATVDELQKVSGIGAKTVEKLRPLVRVD